MSPFSFYQRPFFTWGVASEGESGTNIEENEGANLSEFKSSDYGEMKGVEGELVKSQRCSALRRRQRTTVARVMPRVGLGGRKNMQVSQKWRHN